MGRPSFLYLEGEKLPSGGGLTAFLSSTGQPKGYPQKSISQNIPKSNKKSVPGSYP